LMCMSPWQRGQPFKNNIDSSLPKSLIRHHLRQLCGNGRRAVLISVSPALLSRCESFHIGYEERMKVDPSDVIKAWRRPRLDRGCFRSLDARSLGRVFDQRASNPCARSHPSAGRHHPDRHDAVLTSIRVSAQRGALNHRIAAFANLTALTSRRKTPPVMLPGHTSGVRRVYEFDW